MGAITWPPPVKRRRKRVDVNEATNEAVVRTMFAWADAEAERSRCAYCRSAWRADASGVCKSCGAPPQRTRQVLPDWDDIPVGKAQERAGY